MGSHRKESSEKYVLTLYIASMNVRARFAIENIKRICEEHLEGRYDLEVIDLRENPGLALKVNVVATPMLIRRLPPPIRTFIGNMKDLDKILVGLEMKSLEEKESSKSPAT